MGPNHMPLPREWRNGTAEAGKRVRGGCQFGGRGGAGPFSLSDGWL